MKTSEISKEFRSTIFLSINFCFRKLFKESKNVTNHTTIIESNSVNSKAKIGYIKKSGFDSSMGTADKKGHSNIETPSDIAV